jgi:hypothetical protein
MEKVSADTISKLTATYVLPSSEPVKPQPAAPELIKQVRADLQKKIDDLTKSMGGSSQRSAFSIARDKALIELATFEKIVANPPKGFRLAPVLYSRINSRQNDKTYSQFTAYVRRDFMRFLAENHAEELRTLGIAPAGIERMKAGLSPVNESGRLYEVNVDHIIERFGGGKASLTEEIDPQRPPGSGKTFLVNHFSNLLLLPKTVHELKNKLNEIQNVVQQGKPKWVLMVVPEAAPGHSGYVAQPQKERLETQEKRQPRNNLSVYRMNALEVAESTLEEINGIFVSITKAPEQKEEYEAMLKPALEDMSIRLETAFNEAHKPHHSPKPFKAFYEGKNFSTLREKVAALPVNQSDKLRTTIESIDTGLKDTYNLRARRTANNNQKPPAPPQIDNQGFTLPVKHEKKYQSQGQSKKVKKHSNGSMPSTKRRH